MHEYTNVEVLPLDDQQSKNGKQTGKVLSLKKESNQSYSILLKGGEISVNSIVLRIRFVSFRFIEYNDNNIR